MVNFWVTTGSKCIKKNKGWTLSRYVRCYQQKVKLLTNILEKNVTSIINKMPTLWNTVLQEVRISPDKNLILLNMFLS